jgi:hypothetical protein
MASSERLVAGKRSRRAGIHHTYIGLLERGERKPTIEVADRVARAHGKKLSALIARPVD